MVRCAVALFIAATTANADISYGGYTFDDDAFADRATRNGPGSLFFNDANSLTAALTGFSPDSGLYNIGLGPNANDFTLFFDDITAVDGDGADIVLFDLRWSADPYFIAVISGGVETTYFEYFASEAIATGEIHDEGVAEAFAFEIDLSEYGVSSAEGIRFLGLPSADGLIQGDPTMAGVLNGVPSPATAGVLAMGGLLGIRRDRRA